MSASFQTPEQGPEVQTASMPDVPGPDGIETETWSAVFERRFVPSDEPGRSTGWLRMSAAVPDDPLLHACALAYESDDLPTNAIVSLHPDRTPGPMDEEQPFFSASLDHAIWFHRPFRADEWLLHDLTSHALMSSRGLAVGHVFTREGQHVATVSQEALLRTSRR
jgi:acyl-CoA thioesterase-2